MLRRAFTLIEVLATIATIATLVGLLLPSLAGARGAAHSTACATSARQLALAVQTYALDFRDRAPPGAADFLKNLSRWHGSRSRPSDPFTPAGGPLSAYLNQERGGDASGGGGGRACPTFRPTLNQLAALPAATAGSGFERGCGGYGYNNAYVGVERRRAADSSSVIVSDRTGSRLSAFAQPSGTIVFADAAFVSGTAPGSLIEYSFAEPRFWPDSPASAFRADPSIHFRHGGGAGRHANMAMLDGHAAPARRTFTWASDIYGPPDPAAGGSPDRWLGWPGARDDNDLFDYD